MTLALIAALVGMSQAGDVVLWDNELQANGVSGMAVSGPRFPTTRVADDFIVPEGQRWHIKRFTYVAANEPTWKDGGISEICVWSDNGGRPDKTVAEGISPHSRSFQTVIDGMDCYIYAVKGLDIVLSPGRYWIGPHHPEASGEGTSWWMTSSGGKREPANLQGWVSHDYQNGKGNWTTLDGNGWDGGYWHQAFQIGGRVLRGGEQ